MALQKCPYCGYMLDSYEFTIDHIIPQSFCKSYLSGSGVKNAYYNKVKVCFSCNRNKSQEIWIPSYSLDGWMRNLDENFIEGYSRIFFEVLKVRKDEVIHWIFLYNYLAHSDYSLDKIKTIKEIEKALEVFLWHYIWNNKYGLWKPKIYY